MKWRPPGRRKRGKPKLTWAEGIRGLMDEKGTGGGRLERQTHLEEEDNVTAKRAQEDVKTSYSLLNINNNNNNNNLGTSYDVAAMPSVIIFRFYIFLQSLLQIYSDWRTVVQYAVHRHFLFFPS
jgi:hypothetical protein